MPMVSPLGFWAFNETMHGECLAHCNGKSVKFPPVPGGLTSDWRHSSKTWIWGAELIGSVPETIHLLVEGRSFQPLVLWSLSYVRLFATSWTVALDFPSPSLSPGLCSNACPLNPWCHPTTSSSVVPFSSCLQSFPASGSFPSQFFSSGGQRIGASATRGHQLHGKERAEFQRLSPLPWNECHLIYFLGTKFGCGWC